MPDAARGPGGLLSLTLAGTLVVLAAMFVVTPRTIALRDRHATLAYAVTLPLVAVSHDGKLFHDPRCPVIHGPTTLEPMTAAMEQHFVPCPRCLGTLRSKVQPQPRELARLDGHDQLRVSTGN
jgi:hypothetical protein